MNISVRVQARRCLSVASIAALTAVVIGAFGAHSLNELLLANGRMATFGTASDYHFYHAFGMFVIGLLTLHGYSSKLLLWAYRFMLTGMLVFSGSLYILSISNTVWLGAIAPVGGCLLVISWVMCLIAVVKSK